LGVQHTNIGQVTNDIHGSQKRGVETITGDLRGGAYLGRKPHGCEFTPPPRNTMEPN